MALPHTVNAGQEGHVTHHNEIHQLLAGIPWNNIAGFHSLQEAHDSLPATGGGLLIPSNYTVTINQAVKITKPVTILGFGRGSMIQSQGQGAWDLLEVSGINQFSMSGVTLDGGYPDRRSGSLISFTDCSNALIDQCRLVNAPHAAVVISRGEHIWIERNYMFNLGTAGVRMNNPGANESNAHIWIVRNYIEKYQQSGVAGNAAVQSDGENRSGQLQEHFFILYNQIMSIAPSWVGIGLDWTTDSLVEGNTIIGVGNGPQGEGIAFTGSRNRIIANRTKNTNAAGILLWATARDGNADNEIAHNICTNAAQGIALVWGESNAVISNLSIHHNRCFDEGRGTQQWGVQSYAHDGVNGFSWNGIDIHDNNLRGNVSGTHNLLLAETAMLRNNVSDELSYDTTTAGPMGNQGLLRLGGHTLWVDSTGKLRIKHGAPISETDGTVVGTQT